MQNQFEAHYGGLKVLGVSLSGIRTCVVLPEYKLAFDLAQAFPFAASVKKFFITHGHMDHAGGIPSMISQKNIGQTLNPQFYMPSALKDPLRDIIKIWESIENHQYSYEFHGHAPGDRIDLDEHHFIQCFETVHRIPSMGYTLFQRKKHLNSIFEGLGREDLLRIKSEGRDLNLTTEIPLFSFTGDTQIEFLDRVSSEVRKSKVLMMDLTYFDSRKSISHAKEWGHTHLDELIPRLDEIECEHIVLMHTSARYTTKQLIEILDAKVPSSHRGRISIFKA